MELSQTDYEKTGLLQQHAIHSSSDCCCFLTLVIIHIHVSSIHVSNPINSNNRSKQQLSLSLSISDSNKLSGVVVLLNDDLAEHGDLERLIADEVGVPLVRAGAYA